MDEDVRSGVIGGGERGVLGVTGQVGWEASGRKRGSDSVARAGEGRGLLTDLDEPERTSFLKDEARARRGERGDFWKAGEQGVGGGGGARGSW
jgi:hypothetical protein